MSKEKSTKLQNELLDLLADKIDSKEYSEVECCGAVVGLFMNTMVAVFENKEQALDFVKLDTLKYIDKAFELKEAAKEKDNA